jgi:hypothetical protein
MLEVNPNKRPKASKMLKILKTWGDPNVKILADAGQENRSLTNSSQTPLFRATMP